MPGGDFGNAVAAVAGEDARGCRLASAVGTRDEDELERREGMGRGEKRREGSGREEEEKREIDKE